MEAKLVLSVLTTVMWKKKIHLIIYHLIIVILLDIMKFIKTLKIITQKNFVKM